MPQDAGAFARAASAAGLRRFTEIDHRTETASTNADAQALLGDPAAAGRTIVADVQSAGVGRHGRTWVAAPRTGLLFTAILPEPLPTEVLWAVPLWAGLGLSAALERRGVKTVLQWPNDLLLDGRKLSGILCVSRIAGKRAWVGCGIGVNVTRPPSDPGLEAIVPPPIFLSDVTALDGDPRPELLASILLELERDLPALYEPDAIARRWETRAGLPGMPYRFSVNGETVEGPALRIESGGAIVVASERAERTIELGDARVLRA